MNLNDDFSKPVNPVGKVASMPPRNILAPIDVDGARTEEIDYAVTLAEHYGADLWLMPLTKELGVAADVRGICSYVHNSWSHRTQVRLWDLVLEARQRHYRTFPISACCGNGSHQILQVAERLKADLIILGRSGQGNSLAGLARSEADALLRQAKSPIIMATADSIRRQ